jgi:hypothetical protein
MRQEVAFFEKNSSGALVSRTVGRELFWAMKRAQLEICGWDFDGIVSKKLKQWWLNGIIMLVISHMISPFDPYSYYRWVLIDLGGRGSKFMAQLNNRVRSLSRNDPPNLVSTLVRQI